MEKNSKRDTSVITVPGHSAKIYDSFSQVLGEINPGGWHNKNTGLGVVGKDKRLGAGVSYRNLTEFEVEELFGADDIAARVVTEPAQKATQKWVNLEVGIEDGGSEVEEKIRKDAERLDLKSKCFESLEWASLYGGAGIFLAVDDGKSIEEPLDLTTIRKVRNLAVLHRWELHAHEVEYNIESPNFGLPKYYQLGARGTHGTGNKRVHHSRIVRFDGARLPRRLFERNNYWGDSVLTRLFNVLRSFNLAHDSTATIMQDFRQNIIKIKGLADIVASGNGELLKSRIETMNLSKSVLGAIVLDDEESFDNVATTLNGIENLLDKINGRLVAATSLPHTWVLGEGATGTLGGGGESERKALNGFVEAIQTNKLEKPLDRLYAVIMAAKQGPTNGEILESFNYKFNPLEEPTEAEKLGNQKTAAETDDINIRNQIYSPDEARDSRYGGEQFGTEITVEKDETEFNTDEAGDHGHSDPLGGYTSGAILEDGTPASEGEVNHVHTRPNGKQSGAAVYLETGQHFHRTGDEPGPGMPLAVTSVEINLGVVESVEAMLKAEDLKE